MAFFDNSYKVCFVLEADYYKLFAQFLVTTDQKVRGEEDVEN